MNNANLLVPIVIGSRLCTQRSVSNRTERPVINRFGLWCVAVYLIVIGRNYLAGGFIVLGGYVL